MMQSLKDQIASLLRWSEKYTKTDMIYLASGGFWSIVGQCSAILTTLALALVVGRYLPQDAYGNYKYVLSIVAILGSLTLTGLPSTVFRSIAHGFDGALRDAFWYNIRWSVLMFIGAVAVAAYYIHGGNWDLAVGILIGGCLSPFLASANLTQSLLTAKKDFRRNVLYFDVVDNIVPVAALIITIFITKNFLALVAVYFLSNTLIALYLYVRATQVYKPDTSLIDPTMRSYGKHLSAMGVIATFASNLDQILLYHYTGAVELAIYNFATAIPDQTTGPLKYLDSMIQAGFAKRTDPEIREGMPSKVLLLGLFYVVATVGYIIIAPYVFTWLFPKYVDAIWYSQLYAVSLLTFPYNIFSSYLTIKRKVKEQYIATLSLSIFKIAAFAVGVIWWGLVGLIIARILCKLFMTIAQFILYRTSMTD